MMCLQMLVEIDFFFCHFLFLFFSLCCHPASPQISYSPIFGLGRCPWPGVRFLSWLPPRPNEERPLRPWTLLVLVYVIIFIFYHWSKMEQVCLIQSVKSDWEKERHICCENSCAGERRDCCNSQLKNCVALRRATVF